MERRAVLQLGAGLTAAAAVGVAGGVAGDRYFLRDNDSGFAVTRQGMGALGARLTVWRGSPDQPIAALTFDDGPTPLYTPHVLKALADADAPATFFMMGKHVTRYPNLARQVAERHEVGNHSYTHPDMSHANSATALDELGRTHQVI
ncbi:MAG: polysaccharide deacetylase family protein, partial [Terriglobales bacterium]